MSRRSAKRSSAGPVPARMIKWAAGALAALIVSLAAVQQAPVPVGKEAAALTQAHRVVYVSDGDTFKLENGERVRLIGVDAPEAHENLKLERDSRKSSKSKTALLEMGRKASVFSRDLLMDKQVRLEFDVEHRDRYQRLLAYVYLQDGTFVNEKIIRAGYAYPMTVPPNVRHADEFKKWFDEARENRRGLWK